MPTETITRTCQLCHDIVDDDGCEGDNGWVCSRHANYCAQCESAYHPHLEGSDYRICPDCSELYTRCNECGGVVLREDCVEIGDNYVCSNCQVYYSTCDDCGDYHHTSNMYTTDEGHICCDCRSNYTNCGNCGNMVHNDHITSSNRASLCEGCMEDGLTLCEHCGRIVDSSDCDEGGCSRCQDTWPTPRWVCDDPGYTITKGHMTFGIEIETSQCEGYRKLRNNARFGCKMDCSITGKEFVSPILRGDAGLEYLRDFLWQCREFDVDNRCGLHVHIGVTDLTDREKFNICKNLELAENCIEATLPYARKRRYQDTMGHGYAQSLKWPHYSSFEGLCDSVNDRYKWANVAAYNEHGTIEFRCFEGSLDYTDISMWVCTLLQLCEFFRENRIFGGTRLEVRNQLLPALTPQVAKWFKGRYNKYRNHNTMNTYC